MEPFLSRVLRESSEDEEDDADEEPSDDEEALRFRRRASAFVFPRDDDGTARDDLSPDRFLGDLLTRLRSLDADLLERLRERALPCLSLGDSASLDLCAFQ